MQQPQTRILCLGNEIVSDDGIGIRVGRLLCGLELPPGVQVEFHMGLGFELIDTLRAGEQLVLVDAMQIGVAPGTCQVLQVQEVESMAETPYCCHGMGLSEILKLARRLCPERMPRRFTIVGIEALVLDRFGTTLSDELKQALPQAVATVLELVGASEELIRQGREQAQKLRDWEPEATDVPGLSQVTTR